LYFYRPFALGLSEGDKMKQPQNQNPEIYFHVGTSKTGTTFLQHRIFKHFKGLHYVAKRNRQALKYMAKKPYQRYLVSDEFDRQFEREVTHFAQHHPQATPIIVFRKHEGYIASQYRRFVKNGYLGSFTEFLDLKNDQGFFKIKHLNYMYQVRFLEDHFTPKPIVLFYEDLRKNPVAFIERLAEYVGASVEISKLNLSKKHTSYNPKQLKGMRYLGKFINMEKRRIFKNGLLHFLWRLYLGTIRYSALYVAKLLPDSFYDAAPLIAPAKLEAVGTYFAQDWKDCQAYARQVNATHISK
jgi:glycosyltransferase involved in cell wall biosynthesis